MALPELAPAARAAAAAADRRRSPRRPHTAQAWLSSPTGGQRTEVLCLDLSRHGVGLSLARPIPDGTFYILELGLGAQRIVCEIRIIGCQPAPDGSYRASGAFC